MAKDKDPLEDIMADSDDRMIIRLVCVAAAAVSVIGNEDTSAQGVVKRAEKLEKFVVEGSHKEQDH